MKKKTKTMVKKMIKKVIKKASAAKVKKVVASRVAAPARPVVQKAVQPERKGIIPLGDRVLVKPFTGNENEGGAGQTNSFGLIIPETVSKERPEQGVVTAVGDGRTTDDGALVPMKVAVGDTVVFSKYGFDEVKMNGEEFYIIKEENILAIIRK